MIRVVQLESSFPNGTQPVEGSPAPIESGRR